MDSVDPIDPLGHLFRREAGRLVSTLTRILGPAHLALAEDAVQDALCRALETWKISGLPDEPAAWLLTAAKNRALDLLRRERTARTFAPEVARHFDEALAAIAPSESDLLRMMFSCCDPRLAEEAQVALVLHILCGFSIGEIAAAFLSNEETIKKRITRAKAVLAGSNDLFDLANEDFAARLSSVQRALYLLFNEGFHGAGAEAVRAELCDEAMRLAALLCAHSLTAAPASFALSALMCLHAARLPARLDAAGDFTLLHEQDRSRWNLQLVDEGLRLMDRSAAGTSVSTYHVESAIAALHAVARRPEETPWGAIVSLYDSLMELKPSPVVALNRALAIAQRDGAEHGLRELRAIADRELLAGYPFYEAALGELELACGRVAAARGHFVAALGEARNSAERRFFERRIAETADPSKSS